MIAQDEPFDVMVYVKPEIYLQKINMPISEPIAPVTTRISINGNIYQLDTYDLDEIHVHDITFDDTFPTVVPTDEAIIISLTGYNCVFTNCVFIIENTENIICNFNGSFFQNCRFDGIFLKSKFVNCIFNSCTFNETTHIDECNFTNAIIENSVLNDITGERTTFKNTKLYNNNLEDSFLRGSDFTKATLKKINMKGTYLDSKKNNRDDRNVTKFIKTIIDDVDFEGATMEHAEFNNAVMKHVNFEDADLEMVNLKDAYMDDVNLTGADLQNTILTGTHIKNVNFTRTILWNYDNIRKSKVYPNLDNTKLDIETCYFIHNNEKIIFTNINVEKSKILIQEEIMNKSFVFYFQELLLKRIKDNKAAAEIANVFSKFNANEIPEQKYLLSFFVKPERIEEVEDIIEKNKQKREKIKRSRIKKDTGINMGYKNVQAENNEEVQQKKQKRFGGKKTGKKSKKSGKKTRKNTIFRK
jgi:uncharacterized protein YjbI with pentapeptide repeats